MWGKWKAGHRVVLPQATSFAPSPSGNHRLIVTNPSGLQAQASARLSLIRLPRLIAIEARSERQETDKMMERHSVARTKR